MRRKILSIYLYLKYRQLVCTSLSTFGRARYPRYAPFGAPDKPLLEYLISRSTLSNLARDLAGPAAAKATKQTALSVDVVKQYPGQRQVDRRVMVNIPGKLFLQLTGAERRLPSIWASPSRVPGHCTPCSANRQRLLHPRQSSLQQKGPRERSSLAREVNSQVIEGLAAVADRDSN